MSARSCVELSPMQAAELVCRECARHCAEHYGPRLRSVVVTGSLARDEATFFPDSRALWLLGDAEFLLIFQDAAAPPAEAEVRELARRIETGLRVGHRLAAPIALSAGTGGYLRALRPHIFAFELRECGRVVWGDREVLALIPRFAAADIPREDAWRLLANRLVEQLAAVAQPGAPGPDACREVRYRTVKLYLDMATSLLVFAGAYAPTYRRRAEMLDQLARRDRAAGSWPFPLDEFADRVSRSTRLKLDPPGAAAPAPLDGDADGLLDWRAAVSHARRLWRWELARLAGADPDLGDRALMVRWMRAQPLPSRARGWLSVVRRSGGWRGWPSWSRWARLARRGSPRYLVYAAAAELLFGLSALGGPADGPASLPVDGLAEVVPVRRTAGVDGGPTGWKELAADIVWNYHEFLVDTRA